MIGRKAALLYRFIARAAGGLGIQEYCTIGAVFIALVEHIKRYPWRWEPGHCYINIGYAHNFQFLNPTFNKTEPLVYL